MDSLHSARSNPALKLSRGLRGVGASALAAPLAVVAGLALCAPATAPALADPASLEGSWSGGGSVAFASGQRERARCRASYRRASGSSYLVTATCATPSGSATQTATVRRVGGNTYQGQFHNSEYNVSGTISVTVGGNRQSVSLSGDGTSADFVLRR